MFTAHPYAQSYPTQRRFDVCIGRLAAIAGIVYVALATLWSATAGGATQASGVIADSPRGARVPGRPGHLDVRLALLADVVATRRESGPARRIPLDPAIRPAIVARADEATTRRPA
jgi:hypothetical protein